MLSTKEKIIVCEDFIQYPITYFMENFYFSDLCIKVVEDICNNNICLEDNGIKSLYNEIENSIDKCMIDNRKYIDFYVNLILSRIIETYLIISMKEKEFMLCGTDKDSLITFRKSHFPDLYSVSEDTYYEVCVNYSTFAYVNNYFALRDNKLPYLINLSKTKKVKLIFVSLYNRMYQIVDINTFTKYRYEQSLNCYGGKNCYSIILDKKSWKKF